MRVRRITAVAGGLLAMVVVASALTTAVTRDGAAAAAAVDASSSRTVTLITGDRVHLTGDGHGRTIASLVPTVPSRAEGSPSRARSMSVGDHTYVVPEVAMPYLGRQLALSLFDVTRPPKEIEVAWAPHASPHSVPGLSLRKAHDGTSTGTVSSPAELGAALAVAAGGPVGVLAGIRGIRPAGADASVDAEAHIDTVTDPGGGSSAPGRGAMSTDSEPVRPLYPQATLVVRGIDALGGPARSGGVSVSNADDVLRFGSMRSFANGEVAFSVPIGTYSLSIDIPTWSADNTYVSDAVVILPEITVTSPETVVTADARTATTAVAVPATPRPATSEQIQLTYGRTSATGGSSTTTYLLLGGAPRVFVTPTQPVTVGQMHCYAFFHLSAPKSSTERYTYDLHQPADGVIPKQFPASVPESELARIDAAYHSDVPNHTINLQRASIVDWEMMPFRGTGAATAPLRRTEYVSALPDVGWIGVVYWQPDEGVGYVQGPLAYYQPGARRTDNQLAAPLAPGPATGSETVAPCAVCRQGDVLSVNLFPWKDPGGHTVSQLADTSTLTASAEARLYVDDRLQGLPTVPTGSITVPSAEAQFRLELDTVKSASWTTTTTASSTVWKWRSSTRSGTLVTNLECSDGTRECVVEPLLLTGYSTQVGLDNAVPAGAATEISLAVYHQAEDAPAVTSVTFEVSSDDGKNWQPVTVQTRGAGQYTGRVTPATGAKFLSFRLHANDAANGSIDQIITRAIRVSSD